MKRVLSVILAVFMLATFVVCGSTTAVAAAEQASYHFGFSLPTLDVTFFGHMNVALQKIYPTDRITLTILNGENNQQKQVSDIENLIGMGVDGIVLIPITIEGTLPAIRLANEHNIPVITVDRAIAEGSGVDIVSFVGSDHYPLGLQAGEMLVEALEEHFPDAEEWKVVELEGTPGSHPAIQRGLAINSIISANPRINKIASLNGEFQTTTAMNIAENILTANPDIHAFVCHNDMMAEGVRQALINHGKLREVVIIGIDGQISTVEAIAEGTIHGTVIQYPDRMAVRGIELLAEFVDGKQVDPIVYVPTDKIPPSEAQRFIDEGIAW